VVIQCVTCWLVASCGSGTACVPTRCGEVGGGMGQLLSAAEAARCRHQSFHRGRVCSLVFMLWYSVLLLNIFICHQAAAEQNTEKKEKYRDSQTHTFNNGIKHKRTWKAVISKVWRLVWHRHFSDDVLFITASASLVFEKGWLSIDGNSLLSGQSVFNFLPSVLLHYWLGIRKSIWLAYNKNSSGDEIANVNFFYNIAHVEASAYAHWTSS